MAEIEDLFEDTRSNKPMMANLLEEKIVGKPVATKRSFFNSDETKSLTFGLNKCPRDPLKLK